MNKGIVRMEYRKSMRQILIWLSVVIGYSALIMVFYISFSGTMDQMTDLFDDASIQGLLRAFSMDTNTFSHILNFYSSYSSIYSILFGCIFGSVLTVHLFAREVREGTYEFTYSVPVSRTRFFISKAFVAFSFVIILNLAMFITGFVLLEALKEKSPRVVWLTESNREVAAERIKEDKDKFVEVFQPDDELFYNVIYDTALSGVNMMSDEEREELNITDEEIGIMLSSFLTGPEEFLQKMKGNPYIYMKIFNIPKDKEQEFIKNLDEEIEIFIQMKESFGSNPSVGIELFRENPKPFLDSILEKDRLDDFKTAYGYTDKEIDRLFIFYSLGNFIVLSLNIMLIMLTLMSISLLLSVVLKRGRFSTGYAVGIALFFYFTDMLANLTEKADFLKHITPFSYKDMNLMNIDYGIDTWRYFVLIGAICLCTVTGGLVFRKTDYIS